MKNIINNYDTDTSEKFKSAAGKIKKMGKVLIALSGGVDSGLLLKIAIDALGEGNVVAVTVKTPLTSDSEIEEAKKISKLLNCRHVIREKNILENENVRKNLKRRCYFCKKEVFCLISDVSAQLSIKYILDGTNFNDTFTYRPGVKALKEYDVISPFIEEKITKDEIRQYANKLNLPFFNKPSSACLATRIPYYSNITLQKLEKIKKAESFLRNMGFYNLRVRYHNRHSEIARIEIDSNDFGTVIDKKNRQRIIEGLKKLGFKYITLDLEGFRSGSMDE